MAASPATRDGRPPSVVARLGFDHGWLCLAPTFLNLGLPVLLVDHRLLPDQVHLGLEPFGTRNPRQPLPVTRIVVEQHPGAMISLWHHPAATGPADLLGWHRAAPTPHPGHHEAWARASTGAAVVIIGDTHHIELCWAAVWDSHIGRARLIDTAQQQTAGRANTDGCRPAGAARSA